MLSTDEEIITTLKQNKSKGIRLLFNRYYHALVVYAEQIIRDNQHAEDLVQDFYVRLWEDNYLQQVSAGGLASYMYTAVRNSCITRQTRKDILRHSEELTEVEVPAEAFMAVDEERVNRIMQEIERLPERTRQVVEYVIFKELKYKEAAAQMNVSVNTVKFLLKEATRRLRNSLNPSEQKIFFVFFQKYL